MNETFGQLLMLSAGSAMSSLRRSLVRVYEHVARNPLARLYDGATLLFVALFHRVLAAKFLRAPLGFDEHYFLYEGWSLTKGLIPYRDFQEFKPPMIFVVNALGIKLFGLGATAYRHIFSILSLCGFLCLTIALLSRGTSRLLAAAVLALMIHHFFDGSFHDSSINNAESLGLDFFMMGCGILLIDTQYERVQQIAGGVLLALSPLSKEPLVFATVAAWLGLLSLHQFDSARRHAARRFALFTTAGAAAVAVTWLLYMLATRSLSWYVVQLKLSIAYTKNYAYQLGWFPKTPTDGVAVEIWKRLRDNYVNPAHLGVFAPLFIALLLLGRRKWIVGLTALATAIGALYGVTIGHGFAPHYFIMAMTGTFFCAVVGTIALDGYARRSGIAMRRWLGLSWGAVALITVWPRLSDEWEKFPQYKPADPPVSQGEVALVRARSNPGDRIWTLGDPLLYVYSDRLNALREGIVIDELIQYYPGDTDEQRLAGQREELLTNRPRLVVFGEDSVAYHRKQRHISALVMPFLRDCGYAKIDDKMYVRP